MLGPHSSAGGQLCERAISPLHSPVCQTMTEENSVSGQQRQVRNFQRGRSGSLKGQVRMRAAEKARKGVTSCVPEWPAVQEETGQARGVVDIERQTLKTHVQGPRRRRPEK